MEEQQAREKANSDKIEAFEKNVSADIDLEYARLIVSLDMKGLTVDEVNELYAECRKARSRRMLRELGY